MNKQNQWLEGICREVNIPLQSLGLQTQMSKILNRKFCLWVTYPSPCILICYLGWVALVRLAKKTDNRKNLQMMAWSHHCSFDILLKSNSSLNAQFLIALSWPLSPPWVMIKLLWPAAQISSKSGLKFLDNHQNSRLQIVFFLNGCYMVRSTLWNKGIQSLGWSFLARRENSSRHGLFHQPFSWGKHRRKLWAKG